MRVLVVEDDRNLGTFVEKALAEASYAVDRAATLGEARMRIGSGSYDLVTLDVALPDGSGLEFLREMRGAGFSAPVLVVSSRGEVRQKVEGLDLGADDYLVKPFALDELLSRVRALLRRGRGDASPVLALGDLALNEVAHRVTVRGGEVTLTPKEFALLRALLRAPGAVVSRTQLVNSVWNWAFDGYSNVVDVHVSSLRKKLRGARVRFRSVPKVGYCLEAAPPGAAVEPGA